MVATSASNDRIAAISLYASASSLYFHMTNVGGKHELNTQWKHADENLLVALILHTIYIGWTTGQLYKVKENNVDGKNMKMGRASQGWCEKWNVHWRSG